MIIVANGFYKFTEDDIARFHTSYTKTDNGCWEWNLSLYNGYGQFKTGLSIKPRRYFKAHRAAWMILNGEIPCDMLVLHHCDNRKCVNPGHLWIGTNQDNVNDMMAKGRHKSVYKEKLTVNDIKTIRCKHKSGTKVADIILEFGRDRNTIEDIIYRQTWKNTK